MNDKEDKSCPIVLERREFPWHVLRRLVLVSMSRDTPHLVGSSIYKAFYYKDYDIMETVSLSGTSLKQAVESLESQVLSVIKRLVISKDIHFTELKCGHSPIFEQLYKISLTKNYNKTENELDKVAKFIKEDDMKECVKLLRNKKYYDFNELIRSKYYVLRWTITECLNQKKKLIDGSFITLKTALSHPNMLKLDAIINTQYTFREVSVIYTCYYTSNGKKKYVTEEIDNMYFPCGSTEQVKFYLNHNVLKSLKRLFMLCKFILENPSNKYKEFKDEACTLLTILISVMQSDAAKLDQIEDEFSVMLKLLQSIMGGYLSESIKRRMSIYEEMIIQILGFASRFTASFENSTNEKQQEIKYRIYNLIKTINDQVIENTINISQNGTFEFKKSELEFQNQLLMSLEKLIKYTNPLIRKLTLKQLKTHNISKTNIKDFIQRIYSKEC